MGADEGSTGKAHTVNGGPRQGRGDSERQGERGSGRLRRDTEARPQALGLSLCARVASSCASLLWRMPRAAPDSPTLRRAPFRGRRRAAVPEGESRGGAGGRERGRERERGRWHNSCVCVCAVRLCVCD